MNSNSEEIQQLMEKANRAEIQNHFPEALAALQQAMDLLPIGSIQRQHIKEQIETLTIRMNGSPSLRRTRTENTRPPKIPAPAGRPVGKAGLVGFLLYLLAKFKFLILGLTKLHTLFSMLLFFGVYWNMWGWKFALGFVLSIYIHEMGHVYTLNRYGIKATAPLFIPFVGAIIRVKQVMVDPKEDSRVGLAGPTWGLGAALAAFALYFATGDPIFAAIARVAAWINLFNLIPFWQLDGGRGFHSMASWQRWIVVLTIGLMWVYTQEGLLLVLLLFSLIKAFDKKSPAEPDWEGLIQYVALVVILSLMCMIPVEMPTS